ncbi:pyridoxal phosphate-dependent aminotransferase [Candidatus Woesearchaeota archaeon]|nr:pyridoxal phosphate-dependent aminotransferase [Candidatus Woesearchaeota archaeon]
MPHLAKKAAQVIVSPIRKIVEEIEKAGDDTSIISFGGGASNIAPPQEVLDYLKNQLDRNPQQATAYGSTKGHYKTRKIITNYILKNEGINVNPSTEIMITTGSTEAIFLAFLALIEQGDEVILADPTYCYAEPLGLLGGIIKTIPVVLEDGFQINISGVKKNLTKKTKLLLLLSPDNPTGRVASREIVQELVLLAEKHDFWLLSDETYKDIIYDKTHYAPRVFGGKNHVITCCSFSKTACIPGLRIGYMYGPENFIQVAAALRQYTTMFPSKPAQLIVEKFLENNSAIKHSFVMNNILPEYKRRRQIMDTCLKKYLPQAKYIVPEGAFYFFVNISSYLNKKKVTSVKEFSEKLLLEEKLVTIPGSFFGKQGENYLRLTFAAETESRIKEGFERFSKFVEE